MRPYDTYRASELLIRDEPSDRHIVEAAYVPVFEPGSASAIGYTIFNVGEVRDDESSNPWSPTRVVWVSDEVDGQVTAHSVTDADAVDTYIQEECVALWMLTNAQKDVVTDFALSSAAGTDDQSRVLLGIFGCEWVLP